MFENDLPTRVRVLILGGGIHGVGVLHDMATRGWKDIHLVEKGLLGTGTSSKSTKLIHGGLRYLKRPGDFGLVTEALRERTLLSQLAPDLVHPMEFLFPILKGAGMPRIMVKTGLVLYDALAGKSPFKRHLSVDKNYLLDKTPIINESVIKTAYSFWDAQTDDLALVNRVAESAHRLGAGISEKCRVVKLAATDDGWRVTVINHLGQQKEISALYVVNALGPWANKLLEDSGIPPTHQAINNKGTHLLFDDLGLKCGLFLQSFKGDGRIFFLLPWLGMTMLGTTEDLFTGNPDDLTVNQKEIDYLLENVNKFLKSPLLKQNIRYTFAGLRWLPIESGQNLSETSRAYVLGEKLCRRGLMITIYGGKLTTYRNLATTIGDRISQHFGEFYPSSTHEKIMWVQSSKPTPSLKDRFQNETLP